jgi:hypothetical protein
MLWDMLMLLSLLWVNISLIESVVLWFFLVHRRRMIDAKAVAAWRVSSRLLPQTQMGEEMKRELLSGQGPMDCQYRIVHFQEA